MLAIYVVSDATGETVERIVRSALVQFKKAPAKVVRRRRWSAADMSARPSSSESSCGKPRIRTP